jgi:hypothetical protein
MMKIPQLLLRHYIVLSLIFGFVAGAIDLRQSEVQPAVFLVVLFSFICGVLKPNYAWLAGCIIGSSIFFVYLGAEILGVKVQHTPEPGVYAPLIALIPAMLSAYLGSFVWHLFFRKVNDSEHPCR